MVCRFKRMELVEYSCEEVKAKFNQWSDDFIKNFDIEDPKTSERYQQWRASIDDFIRKCNCKDCDRSDPKLISNKILEAKEKREKGESPWKK